MPPESFDEGSRYGPRLDIFSFGHLALYTLTQVRRIEGGKRTEHTIACRIGVISQRLEYFFLAAYSVKQQRMTFWSIKLRQLNTMCFLMTCC